MDDHLFSSTADASCLQILIVDDMVAVRELLKYMLEKKGHIVRLADGGQQALVTLNEFPTDVVISDIMMPEMNGYELAQSIRESPQTCNLLLISMSANTDAQSELRSQVAGFDAHLRKPFQFDVLDRVLASRRLERSHDKIT